MVKRLSQIDANAVLNISSDARDLKDDPEIATLYARVIASWASVEGSIGLAAAALIGARGGVGMDIYWSISEHGNRLAALHVAARESLVESDAELFCAALKVVKKAGAVRNTLAHCIVGTSDAAPGCIILVEPKDHVINVKSSFFERPPEGKTKKDHVRDAMKILYDRSFVYGREDLTQALERIDEANEIAVNAAIIASPRHHGAEKAREELRCHPLVAQILS